MHNYRFADATGSAVVRDGALWLSWDVALDRPLAMNSLIGDEWIADGLPTPGSYVPPGPKIADVDVLLNARLSAGFADAETGKNWQCDDSSLLKWTALAAASGFAILMNVQPQPTFSVIALDNTVVVLTAAEIFSLFSQRVMPWVSATILFARTMKNDIIANNPPADITVGWP